MRGLLDLRLHLIEHCDCIKLRLAHLKPRLTVAEGVHYTELPAHRSAPGLEVEKSDANDAQAHEAQ